MDLRYASQHAVSSREMRRRIHWRGRTARGHPLWTTEEDTAVRQLYPDYRALLRALKRRSYFASRHRARFLGMATRRHVWTANEVARVRKLYLTVSTSELMAAFPDMRWHQVSGKARHIGLRGRRRKLQKTGFELLDGVRARATARGWPMVDLDVIALTGKYFQKAGWHSGRVNYGAVCKAIEVLEGRISVSWQ